MAVQPRLASTVMLLRDTEPGGLEVFMVRRAVQSEFMPDVYVFPGGAVSADDHMAERVPGLCMAVSPTTTDPKGYTSLGQGTRTAAIRELFEEANVLLAYQDGQMLAVSTDTAERFSAYRRAFNERRGSLIAMAEAEHLVLATDCLSYFAHWITPEGLPKRYDTHSFLATAPTRQEALYDQLETSDGVWIQPHVALERTAQSTFPVAFPTYHQLHDLAAFTSVRQALEIGATRSVLTHLPTMTQIDGVPHVYLPEDPGHKWNLQQS